MRLFFLSLTLASIAAAQTTPRPEIRGLAHVALYANDLDASLAFYTQFLGFEESFSLSTVNGHGGMAFIKINDRQFIELAPETAPSTDRLSHIALETNDAGAMRRYLASRGVKVPDRTPVGRIGNANFTVRDPDGHSVEIVQYLPDGWSARDRGKHLGSHRVSTRMMHAGLLVGNLAPAVGFYSGVLGFVETWRGSPTPARLSWVNLRVPDGTDYVEFMLYGDLPAPDHRGTQHHICLEVPSVRAAVAALNASPYRSRYARSIEIKTGINRKRQANLFDPDGTRIELMEPNTVDGKPAPSSTAPPPHP
jgi:catechol 2,3-dioxygenase-like lactoylglutathione lyase family enzyme